MRFVNPTAEILVAGGREGHLRSMQPFALYPANSLFVEGYLTTKGDPVNETYQMIRDAGFEIEGNDAYHDERQADSAQGRSEFRIPGGCDELLKPYLKNSPFAADIPNILREAHALLHDEPKKRLSES